jgi:hypothetical protein
MRYLIAVSILIVAATFGGNTFAAEDVSLFDSSGNPVAYVAVDDESTIYLWDGEPVAYLDRLNVYGFNGSHLGWLSNGAVINHDGDAECVFKSRYSGFTNFEPFKGFRQFKPFKSFKEFEPFHPFETNIFSNTPCSLFLSLGR